MFHGVFGGHPFPTCSYKVAAPPTSPGALSDPVEWSPLLTHVGGVMPVRSQFGFALSLCDFRLTLFLWWSLCCASQHLCERISGASRLSQRPRLLLTKNEGEIEK